MSATQKDIEKLVKSLKANNFDPVEFVENAETAVKMVLDMIPLDATVGMPGSTSVRQLGLNDRLRTRGTKVLDITSPGNTPAEELMRQILSADVVLTSSNAITLDGKLVNIDATGNRVAAMIFGPKKVILLLGTNKLVRDVNEATDRIKNVIAPYHSATRKGKTPCTVKGVCTDCGAPDRICNVTTIIEKKPWNTSIAIIIVGEDLGLGWSPEWQQERKDRIAAVYRETRSKFAQAPQNLVKPK